MAHMSVFTNPMRRLSSSRCPRRNGHSLALSQQNNGRCVSVIYLVRAVDNYAALHANRLSSDTLHLVHFIVLLFLQLSFVRRFLTI